MTSDREVYELPRFADLNSAYEIVRELGRGSTAVVYLAYERANGRPVAIKVIRSSHLADDEATARLEREAHTVASLQHPNIVTLYGTRRLRDNSLALIMQHIPGRTLECEVRTGGPLPFDRVERILTELGRGLSCVQRQRIVHRDIKPENIYIDEETGRARLSDFGIARPWDVEQSVTLPGLAIGTPAYMSPEQIAGRELDGRSDLYSLGMVGFEMLTGHQPWAGENLLGIIYKQQHEALPELDTLRPGVPGQLRCALDGLLRKDRDERWRDADEFLTVLRGEVAVPKRWRTVQPNRESAIVGPFEPCVDPTVFPCAVLTVPPEAPSNKSALDSGLSPLPDARAVWPTPATETAAQTALETALPEADPDLLAKVTRLLTDPSPGVAGTRVVRGDIAPDHVEPSTRPRHPAMVVSAAVPMILIGAGLALVLGRIRNDATGVKLSGASGTEPAVGSIVQLSAAGSPRSLLIRAVQGNGQYGLAGDTLHRPLMLRVEDAAGQPVAGITVRFEITRGDGGVEPEIAVTDTTGLVSTRWYLRSPGLHALIAVAPELSSHTIFRAEALPRPRR